MEDLNDSRKDEKYKEEEEDKTKKRRIEVEEFNLIKNLKSDNNDDLKLPLELSESVIMLSHRVFGNPLILRHILRRVPTFYLRYLRLVNKLFEELVTDILIRRGDKGIYFVYDEDTKLRHKFSHPDMPFMDFVECVKASKRFPCSKFWIQMPNFEDEDMKDFLTAVGKQIKVLELKNGETSYAKMSRQVLKSLLLTHCPNIRELRIFDNSDITDPESTPNSNQDINNSSVSESTTSSNTNTKDSGSVKSSCLLPAKHVLPNLEVFGVEGTRTEKNRDVCEILLASPQLKKFYGDSVLYFDDLVKANKIHSIRDLDFVDPLLTEQAHRLSQLEEFRPQIEDIYVYPVDVLEDEQKMSSFLKILEASKMSLNSIYFYLESRFFKPGDLPILPTVSEVELVNTQADGDEDDDEDEEDESEEEENESDNEDGGGDNNRHEQQQQNNEPINNDNNNQHVEIINNIQVDGGVGGNEVPANDNEEQEEQNEIPTFPALFLLHTFPNLKKLHLRFSCTNIRYDGPPILHTIVTSDIILPTVTVLDLHGDLHPELARNIPTVFPNVKDFLSGTIHDFPTVSKYIWEMKKLQWLTLNILVDGETECANSIPEVDAAFIGLNPEDLKNIDNPGDYAKSVQGNIIRKNSSILDLKDLTSLKIELRLANEQLALPVTDHTFELAFRFMCGLKIQMKTYARCSN